MGGWIGARAAAVGAAALLIAAASVPLVAGSAASSSAPCPPSHLRIVGSTVTGTAPASDTTVPVVSIKTPAAGATVSGTAVVISACAVDNVAVAGVQFKLDGANLGIEDTTPAYSITWNTTTVPNGPHTLSAVARDTASNLATAPALVVTVLNGGVRLTPEDTSVRLDATNYSTIPQLTTYTWPDRQVANAILMKFDLSTLPAGAVVQQATLHMSLIASDATPDALYTITASRITGKNPVIASATGYTSDGTTAWTANACCSGGVPLAQADISSAYDTQAIDKTPGDKTWTITTMVQEWINNPASNFGLLLDSDTTALRDRYRYFGSVENTDPAAQPYLYVVYAAAAPDATPPSVSITAPAANASVTGTIAVSAAASDNVGVAGVQFTLDGAPLGTEDVAAPYSVTWSTATAAVGAHSLAAIARDAAGNRTTSAAIPVSVVADTTPPVLSAIAVSSITASGAVITWTTNEPADSQVDYGLTAAYGSTTPLNATLVAAHTVALGGLTGSTVYHFRVRSRDAAGNPAASTDVSFTTAAAATTPWSHEPAGFAPVTDWSMNALTGSGWNINNANGYASIVSDANARVSAPGVGQWLYPVGFAGGDAPATMYYPLPAAFTEGFVGVSWKVSNPWQGHPSNVNKIYFLLGGACGNLIPIMYGPPGGPYDLRVAPEWGSSWNFLTPNVNNVPVALGVWHKIELYFKYNGAGAGVVRWWMDDTLIGDYTNVTFPPSGCFAEFQFSPTWGGVGATKSENDYFWFDHARISVPTASSSGDSTPPTVSVTAPAAGATVSGSAVSVTATASDNVGVAGVQFALDGVNLGAERTSAPYTTSWDTTMAPNGTHTLTARARDAAGNAATSTAVTVTVSNVSQPPPAGTLLFQEGFEDANVAARGWYDNTAVLLSTTEHIPNSVSSIQYTFNAGATTPTAGSALRHKFTPTDSIYLSYWVKYSTNYVGSQQTYHPHEFHFLTTLEGDWAGLSFDHLTAYIEQNGGTPLIAIQDGSNVDQTRIGVNLTAITENRGVAGCNGSSDGYPDNCYSNGSQYVNEKKWRAASQYFGDAPGPSYKGDWHFVEAFLRMNSIVGGKGVNDGVVQYWFDGRLIIDHRNVLLRTGANPTMQFNQFVIAPYIGDGSPVTQSMWIDSVRVGTGKS